MVQDKKEKRGRFESLVSRATEKARQPIRSPLASLNTGSTSLEPMSRPLPMQLESTQSQLLTLESGFAFAYWRIDAAAIEMGIARLGPTAKLYLRFYDVTHSLNVDHAESWDTQVFDREGNWYLKLEQAQQKLCFDVVLKNRHDQSVRLTRSNLTRLPLDFLNRRTPFTGDVEPLLSEVLPTHQPPTPTPQLEEVLGPYFFNLYKAGHLNEITTSSLSALFQEVINLKPRRATL